MVSLSSEEENYLLMPLEGEEKEQTVMVGALRALYFHRNE